MKNLYNMKLNEKISFNDISKAVYKKKMEVIRVPGGWIYNIYSKISALEGRIDYTLSSVFVPFNDEFQGKPEPTPKPYNE